LKAIYLGKFLVDVPEFLMQETNDVIGSFVDSGTSVILVNPYVSFFATECTADNQRSLELSNKLSAKTSVQN
jgi:hypothetical protein